MVRDLPSKDRQVSGAAARVWIGSPGWKWGAERMPKVERVREILSGPLDPNYLSQKAAQGWKLAAINIGVEWQREADAERQDSGELTEEVPFGLQVAKDCLHLEENPAEKQVLMLIMELFVQDLSLSRVAEQLNHKGFRTRQGSTWSPASVFNMFPRLVEVGPRLFSSEEWIARRQHLYKLMGESSRRNSRPI